MGYHITLFNCFVTTISWSGVLTWHKRMFSQAACKGKEEQRHISWWVGWQNSDMGRTAAISDAIWGSAGHRSWLLSPYREQGLRAWQSWAFSLGLFLAYSDTLQLITILCLSFPIYWIGRKSLLGRLIPQRFTENRSYTRKMVAMVPLLNLKLKNIHCQGKEWSTFRQIHSYQLLYIWPEFSLIWK